MKSPSEENTEIKLHLDEKLSELENIIGRRYSNPWKRFVETGKIYGRRNQNEAVLALFYQLVYHSFCKFS